MNDNHLEPIDVIPPARESSTHHYECSDEVCRTVTIDNRNGDVHLTVLVKSVGIERIILTSDQFLAISIFVGKVASNQIHEDHSAIRMVS